MGTRCLRFVCVARVCEKIIAGGQNGDHPPMGPRSEESEASWGHILFVLMPLLWFSPDYVTVALRLAPALMEVFWEVMKRREEVKKGS